MDHVGSYLTTRNHIRPALPSPPALVALGNRKVMVAKVRLGWYQNGSEMLSRLFNSAPIAIGLHCVLHLLSQETNIARACDLYGGQGWPSYAADNRRPAVGSSVVLVGLVNMVDHEADTDTLDERERFIAMLNQLFH
jgi:hypothetical protein